MLKLKVQDGQTVIDLAATKLDAGMARLLKAEFERCLPDMSGTLILDMRSVAFIDSAGLGALVRCLKLAEPQHRLILSMLSPSVERVFRLTRMDRMFEIAQEHPA